MLEHIKIFRGYFCFVKDIKQIFKKHPMRENCPHSEFLWSECEKIRTRKTLNMDIFHAMYASWIFALFFLLSPNPGKYGPDKLQIWTLSTQWSPHPLKCLKPERPVHFWSCIEIKIELNFYFQTSLWCFKRFEHFLRSGLHKTFWGTTKKCGNKNLS